MIQQQIETFYLCIDMGDIIYSLLFSKILNVQNLLLDGGCGQVKFNWKSADFILPLIKYQPYIKSVQLYNHQPYDYNYGHHPDDIPVIAGTDLTKYHASKFDLLDNSRIYEPWLIGPTLNDSSLKHKKIIINRTHRYHGNKQFYYDFLKYYHPNYLLFLGLEEEHKLFQKDFGITIDYIKTDSILELTSIINTIPVFVGNESLICAIAKGLDKMCYVEYCPNAANYIFNRQTINYF